MSLSSPLVAVSVIVVLVGLLVLLIGRSVKNDSAGWAGAAIGLVGVGLSVYFGMQAHDDSEPDPPTGTGRPTGTPTTPATSATRAGPDPLALPPGMAGTWKGIVSQPDGDPDKYAMTLTLVKATAGQGVGRSAYPTLRCTGNLTLATGGDDVRILEDVSQSTCADDELRLTLLDDHNLSVVMWYRNTEIAAGTLRDF